MDLVVSHFNEDLRWLKKVPSVFRIVLYCKAEPPDLSFLEREVVPVTLPNVGREAHTWLVHLEQSCETPPELTVFLQGHPFDHCHDTHQRLRAIAAGTYQLPASGFDWWGFIIETDDPLGRRVFVPWSKNTDSRELDIGKYFQAVFDCPGPELYRFYPGGQFVVSGAAMQRNGREFYTRARQLLEQDEDAAYGLERFWDQLFGVQAVTAEMMGSEQTVYLKKIRRLEKN